MEECLVEIGTRVEPGLSVCVWGVCASNLGFVLYPDMGLPLVKIVALKQTLRNPVYQSLQSQLFAD